MVHSESTCQQCFIQGGKTAITDLYLIFSAILCFNGAIEKKDCSLDRVS